jgi:hypothetical protein
VLKDSEQALKLLKLELQYRGQPLKVVIQPARIESENGDTVDYYQSTSEELIKDALRRIEMPRL